MEKTPRCRSRPRDPHPGDTALKTSRKLDVLLPFAASLAVALAFHLVVAAPARAAGFYVATNGNDGNPGSRARPWRTIAASAAKLSAGDTLYARGGTYFERPTVAVSGTAKRPIVIRSFPDETATLDSGVPQFRTPGNSDWELVNATLGEYRSTRSYTLDEHIYAQIAGIPGYANGRVALVPYNSAAAFRSTSDQYVDPGTPFYAGPGTFWDPADGRFHIRLAKTTDLKAAEARYGTVFDTERPDPRRYSIILSHAYSTLRVTGSYLIFQDLTVNQALNSIYLTGGAHDLAFENVTVWLGDSAIELIGVSRVLLHDCRVYGDSPYWIFWSDMKDAPAPADLMRSTSIDLRSGTHDVEISHCHIRGSGQDLVGVNNNESNLVVHHCRLENAADDAFELEGTVDVGRIELYENYVLNCLTGVAPGQATPHYTGPLFVYRNVFASLRNPPINRKAGINTWNGGFRFGYEYLMKHGTGAADTSDNTHYYQNTMVLLNHGGKGLNFIPKDPTQCRIANNVAVTVNGLVNRDYRGGAGEFVDGNLYWKMNTVDTTPLLSSYTTVTAFNAATGFEAHGLGATARRGTDPRFAGLRLAVVDRTASNWVLDAASETPAMTDFFLSPDSPARGAGVALPTHPVTGALPDSRPAGDLGAIPFGADAAEYQMFPFVPDGPRDTTPPGRPALRLRTR